jgi:hypothetical protein
MSTPVIGWCATARHQGQTLHPIFDHVHHVDHAGHLAAPADDAAGVGTSWSATGAFGTPAWLDSVQALPPLPSLAILPNGGARLRFDAIRPFEHLQAPMPPPPRRAE